MITPALTVNAYLDLLHLSAKDKAKLRQKLVSVLLASVDPADLAGLPRRGYAVAAHWHWPLDAIREAHDELSDANTRAAGMSRMMRHAVASVFPGGRLSS